MQETVFYFSGVCCEMNKLVLDSNALQTLHFFESITRASARDCVSREGEVVFVVNPEDVGKSVGKDGVRVRELEKALKRRVKIVALSPSVTEFVRNVLFPLTLDSVSHEGEVVTVVAEPRVRGAVIGRNASNLRWLELIVQRHFDVKEIVVKKENGK